MAAKYCVCDSCGMEFKVGRFDKKQDLLKDGTEVTVLSFTCPKCDEEYIVQVMDEKSYRMKKELDGLHEKYRTSYDKKVPPEKQDDKIRLIRKDIDFKKKQLLKHTNFLKRKYLKELKHRGR